MLSKGISLIETNKLNQENLEDYKRIVDASSIVTKTDTKGIITYANDKFCEISGYQREELIGKPHNMIRHPDQSVESFKDMWDTIRAKKMWKGTIKNLKKDGGFYYVYATVMPLCDKNGELFEYISLRQDVTELCLLQNELEKRVAQEVEKNRVKEKEAIRNLNLFLDCSPNGIIVFDDSKVAYANNAFLKFIGESKDSFISKEFDFSTLLDQVQGFVTSKEDFVLHKPNKISITIKGIRNIFSLFYEKMDDIDGKSLVMYTLNNITLSEYQKLKITHYNDQLREYYRRNKTSSMYEAMPELEKEIAVEEEAIAKEAKKVRELSDHESSLLKRKHDD